MVDVVGNYSLHRYSKVQYDTVLYNSTYSFLLLFTHQMYLLRFVFAHSLALIYFYVFFINYYLYKIAVLPMDVTDRLSNKNIFFLLILCLILGFIVGINILISSGEILVFNDLIRVFWKTEISYEGNPNYFDSLSAKTLVTRIVTGNA